MNKLAETYGSNLPAKSEAELIGDAAAKDAGFGKMMKFVKGDYIVEGEIVPLGTQFLAHAVGWTKEWIHFENGMPIERRVYPVIKGIAAPERIDMPDLDKSKWAGSLDPWTLQYLLPLESCDSGEVVIFVTGSFGGRRAVADVCSTWSRKVVKDPKAGMPIVKLNKTTFRSRNYGDVLRPYLEITGWEEGSHEGIREIKTDELKREELRREMDDDVPF